MQKKQVYNPFLPLNEYIPDGEPHVFGDRIYLFGSHDREGGYTFCMEDYVVYSAPVNDLSDWRCEGVTYRASQDPNYEKFPYMYAPDVVQGNDGRYYLYYCMAGDYGIGGYHGEISVAVCDKPAGKYEYLGFVKNPDGSPMKKYVCFDPAAINDNGTIRIYYGTQYSMEEESGYTDFVESVQYADPASSKGEAGAKPESFSALSQIELEERYEGVIRAEMDMFGRTRAEILSYPDSINGPNMVVLEDDMLTVKEEARHIIPYRTKGTSFEQHPFFEGASMRRIDGKYYFIYSSWLNHELCYAVSDYPDRDFTFGGTIVSNGDVGFHGRKPGDKLNMTGTTHGSICEVNGQWYVFYHRLTHKSDYSRQACAEKIYFEADGSIPQVEITSCGLNEGPLTAAGHYPAVIACNLTNGNMPHGSNSVYKMPFPNVTNRGDERFIGEVCDGTLIGYKYFDFKSVKRIGVLARFEDEENLVVFDGPLRVDDRVLEDEAKQHEKGVEAAAEALTEKAGEQRHEADRAGQNAAQAENRHVSHGDMHLSEDSCYIELKLEFEGECVGRIELTEEVSGVAHDSFAWHEFMANADVPDGVHALYLIYHGNRKIQMKEIIFG